MRIAHVTATFPPYHGGTGNVCYHNASVLAARGHEVHVFTAARSDGQPLDLSERFVVHRQRPIRALGNAPILPQLLLLRGFDLIHLHCPFITGAEMTAAAAALHGTPLVVTYHHDLLSPGPRGVAFHVYNPVNRACVLTRADKLLATSLDYAHHSLVGTLPPLRDAVAELPNGVDVETFRPAHSPDGAWLRRMRIDPSAPIILFVGGMDTAHYFKGVPVLLEALERLPDAHAVLVGDGDLRAMFQDRAVRTLGHRAHFVGPVPSSVLPCLYQSATVTVLPSTTQGEAFGMVLLESLACGTPVVASDLPGVRTVVSHGIDGYLVAPEDPTALASALRSICASPAGRMEMGLAGRRKVEARYTWEAIGERLEEIYLDVVDGSRRLHG